MSAHHSRHSARRRAPRPFDPAEFVERLSAARRRRSALAASDALTAYRVVDGDGDRLPGIAIDRYGPCAVLNVAEDVGWADRDVTTAARHTLDRLGPDGVEAVYVKPFARDRSRLGGRLPDESRSPTPRAGRRQPEALIVEEYGVRFEVRPYDGLSTGLFLDHREHRRDLGERRPRRALNLFAYTCAFAMPLARRGAEVTNVDVSARYLDWGRRNLAQNGLPAEAMRFLRREARDYLRAAAARADARFDLVVVDPPTFAAADHRRGIAAWRALDHYPDLIRGAVAVLAPGGVVFAATSTRELAAERTLPSMVTAALGRTPRWLPLPPWPADVTAPGRVAAVLFAP